MSKSLRNRHEKYGVIIKFCGKSDKEDKRIANRKFRRKSRVKLKMLDESKLPMNIKEVSNTWNFSSDGLAYYVRFSRRRRFFDAYTDLEIKRLRNK